VAQFVVAKFRSDAVLLRLDADCECDFRGNLRSANGGSRDADGFLSAGELAASTGAAASIIGSLTRRAPEATTPSPIAGKM
jgi:hypothetical protein